MYVKMIKEIINWLKLVWFKYRRTVEIYPISYDEVKEFLSKKFDDCIIEVEDTKYYACAYENAKIIAKLIPTHKIKYSSEFDCDNFSKLYWGVAGAVFPRLPIGRCNVETSKGKHSLNFILYKRKLSNRLRFSFIEPQTGEMRYYNYNPYMMLI